MWMELFVNSNDSSFFLELLATYSHATEKQLIRILKVREITQNILKLPELPILVTNTGEIIRDEKEICELISKLTGQYKNLIGDNETQAHSNFEFIQYIKQQKDNKARLQFLNSHLTLNTFCNGYHATISDLYAFASVLQGILQLTDEDKLTHSNVVRWAHHIQNLKGLKDSLAKQKLAVMLPFEPLYLEADTAKAVDPKEAKKQKKEDAAAGAKDTKPKEDKKKVGEPKKAEGDDSHAISKLDLRVGKIVNIFVNTESEKLYNEEIDIGNGEIRKIASGLKNKVPIEKLKDSLVVVLCNLKARALCGWTSHGMLLCATDDKDNTEPLRPPQGSQPGDLVFVGDFPRQPVPELNPKKNPWDTVKDQLLVNEEKTATYDLKHEWKTDKGLITSETFTKAKIS
jgi:methionine--tRNA ligase beta chain